jgi:hypothetical protein
LRAAHREEYAALTRQHAAERLGIAEKRQCRYYSATPTLSRPTSKFRLRLMTAKDLFYDFKHVAVRSRHREKMTWRQASTSLFLFCTILAGTMTYSSSLRLLLPHRKSPNEETASSGVASGLRRMSMNSIRLREHPGERTRPPARTGGNGYAANSLKRTRGRSTELRASIRGSRFLLGPFSSLTKCLAAFSAEGGGGHALGSLKAASGGCFTGIDAFSIALMRSVGQAMFGSARSSTPVPCTVIWPKLKIFPSSP